MPEAPVAANRVPVEERLFSLVLALLATHGGLTKREILSSVQGYRQRYSPGGDNASLERQFERDKDDIRELGVLLETVEDPADSGNNQNVRYRIPKGSYELPADVTFTPQEITLLGLAATVWREGSLSTQSRRAIMKLRSLGVESDAPILGYAPSLRVRENSFEPLSTALERGVVVTFSYLKPGETMPRLRAVVPLALVQHQGRWHLHGIDQGVQQPRTFLLSRIVDTVHLTAHSFPRNDDDYAAAALAELDSIWNANVAEIEVVADTDAATRLNNKYGSKDRANTRLAVHYTDLNILADELAGYGPEARVLSPAELRDAVRNRLETAVADHTDQGGTNV